MSEVKLIKHHHQNSTSTEWCLSLKHSRLHFVIVSEGLTINGLLPKYIPMRNYFEDNSSSVYGTKI